MVVGNTFPIIIKNTMGDELQYVFNLRHCMYICRNTPTCLRFVFGTHNLVLHFNSLDASHKYLDLFSAYLEHKTETVEIEDSDYEGAEIEIKE